MKKIRRLLFLFVTVLPIALLPLSVRAEGSAHSVGILSDYIFPGNNIHQYSIDCTEDVLGHIGYTQTEFVENNMTDSLNALNDGRLDFLTMVPFSNSLAPYLDYSSDPVAKGFFALYAAADSNLYFNDFKNFDGIKIAVLQNSYIEEYLTAYSAENKFTYTPVYYPTVEEMLEAVRNGAMNAVFIPSTSNINGMRIISKCGDFNYYLAVKKGNAGMLAKINEALKTIRTDKPFYLASGYQNTFKTPYLDTFAMTDVDYTALKNMGELRVLVPTENYPLAYYDTKSKDFAGLYVDILKKISANTGLPIKYIANDHPEMTMSSIEMGQSDAILTVSAAKELIKATEPYANMLYFPVVRSDSVIFEDSALKIGILETDEWITDYLNEIHPEWTFEKYHSIHALFRGVERKETAAALISSPDLQTKTSLIAHPKLSIISDFSVTIPVRLGISSLTCHYTVLNLLNKAIDSVSVSQSQMESRIYSLSHIYVPNVLEMLYINRLFMIITLLIILGIFVIVKLRETYFRRMALTDTLTSLHNARWFFEMVSKIVAKNPSQPYLICSVDAKNFKLVNDRFGRAIGDTAICSIAKDLGKIFNQNGILARAQSDSFLIFAEDTPENRERMESIEKLNIYIHNSSNYHIFLKAGIYPIEKFDNEIGLENYIDRAVIAKDSQPVLNKNFVCFFTKEMEEDIIKRNIIEVEKEQALRNGEFVVYYQPKYELKNDTIIGAEALVRWKKGDEIISPAMFIPLFEKNGFIVEVDFYIYEEIMKMMRKRLDKGKPIVPISMNVSRCHMSDNDFVEKLDRIVEKYNVPKKYIEMEITESIFSGEDNDALMLMRDLKYHGFTISMDDFGSGYSSLNLLREVPIDTLKIDKVFIDNTNNSPRGRAIIEAVIKMAAQIDIQCICEGVETEVQRDFLKAVGCNMVQGFLYSRPLPLSDFESLLDSPN